MAKKANKESERHFLASRPPHHPTTTLLKTLFTVWYAPCQSARQLRIPQCERWRDGISSTRSACSHYALHLKSDTSSPTEQCPALRRAAAAADLWTNSGELSWSLGIMGTKVVMVHLAAFYCGNHQLSLPLHSFFFL